MKQDEILSLTKGYTLYFTRNNSSQVQKVIIKSSPCLCEFLVDYWEDIMSKYKDSWSGYYEKLNNEPSGTRRAVIEAVGMPRRSSLPVYKLPKKQWNPIVSEVGRRTRKNFKGEWVEIKSIEISLGSTNALLVTLEKQS